MPERVKYAAVGLGGMGRRHLRGMARLAESALCNMELVACCDLNQENANFYADEAKELLGTRPKVYADVAQMKRELPDLQAADVTTDSGSHHLAAQACLEEYEGQGLIPHAARMGELLFERLRGVARRHPRVGDVRGKGLLACLELVRDRSTHAPLVPANTDSPVPLAIGRVPYSWPFHAWNGCRPERP